MKHKTVLVVEPDRQLRDVLIEVLQYLHARFIAVDSVEKALQTLSHRSVNNIITDDFGSQWIAIANAAGTTPVTVWSDHPERFCALPHARFIDKAHCNVEEVISTIR
jgi:lambda repressor-like predicted transcriptional regulator